VWLQKIVIVTSLLFFYMHAESIFSCGISELLMLVCFYVLIKMNPQKLLHYRCTHLWPLKLKLY